MVAPCPHMECGVGVWWAITTAKGKGDTPVKAPLREDKRGKTGKNKLEVKIVKPAKKPKLAKDPHLRHRLINFSDLF